MSGKLVTAQFTTNGMTCAGCEMKIEKKLMAINGVKKASASYGKGQVTVSFDSNKTSIKQIEEAIISLGYETVSKAPPRQTPKISAGAKPAQPAKPHLLAAVIVMIIGAYMVFNHLGGSEIFAHFPQAKEGMGYTAILVIGLLTSLHCVGMCGGINISQCLGAAHQCHKLRPSFLYNLGRVISYTAIGAIVGALGSVISFNGAMRGAVALFAGVFMVIMGLNMLNVLPGLRRFSIRMPKFLSRIATGKSNSPLYIGLINGFMPCGPLQAMQLYALSTGDPIKGAMAMFLFSLGTVPLMFGLGAASSMLSRKFTAKMLAVSGVLVILLGVGMFNTGLNMAGYLAVGTEKTDTSATAAFEPVLEDGYQIVTVEVSSRAYAPITVKKGVPVKLNLHVQQQYLNGCNDVVIIPKYNIQAQLAPGDNIIEFTPDETGVIPYSCWMNMIRSSITVVD